MKKRNCLCSGVVGMMVMGTVGLGTPSMTLADIMQNGSSNSLATTQSSPDQIPSLKAQAPMVASYGQLPLSFEVNQGQTDSQVKFLSRGSGYTLFLTPTEAVLSLRTAAHPSPAASIANEAPDATTPETQSAILRMQFSGSNPSPLVTGIEKLPGIVNYFIGNDLNKWRTNIPTYKKVQYKAIYPGIDLIYYGNQRQLEYDFVVAPGVDPNQIKLSFQGAEDLSINGEGHLVLAVAGGKILLLKPHVYQTNNGQKVAIASNYVLHPASNVELVTPEASSLHASHLTPPAVGIQVAAYDVTQPLIIDPVLAYSSYLGDTLEDKGSNIVIDKNGHAYLVGHTTLGGAQFLTSKEGPGGGTDTFVAKLDLLTTPAQQIYTTYIGGTGTDLAHGVAVDGAFNASITGQTDSTNFPSTPGAYQTKKGTGQPLDAYVVKLDLNGGLVYATFLGGSSDDIGWDIALDLPNGARACVTGRTKSANFAKNNVPGTTSKNAGGEDAFVLCLNAAGSRLDHFNYLGGSNDDKGNGIVMNGGNAYVTGTTESSNFPSVGTPFQGAYGGGPSDAFVVKLNSAGTTILYSSFFGGSGEDQGLDLAVDNGGNIYFTGKSNAPNFVQPPGAGNGFGGFDAYVAKLNTANGLNGLVFYTILGGGADDTGNGVALYNPNDPSNPNAPFIIGGTKSADFPISNPLNEGMTINGGFTNVVASDGFVVGLNEFGLLDAADSNTYSTFLGGMADDEGTGIVVDNNGSAFVSGWTNSSDFPIKNPILPFDMPRGGIDAFVALLVLNTPPVAVDDTYDQEAPATDYLSVDEDNTLDTNSSGLSGVLANDSDADLDDLTALLENGPTNGGVVLNADLNVGSFVYTPNQDFNGQDSFDYKANDGKADSNIATVFITVNPVNDPPTFMPGQNVVVIGKGAETVTGWATIISAGPLDETGQVLTFLVSNDNNPLFAAQPAVNPVTGTLTFTPAKGTSGSAQVSVQLMDNGGTDRGGIDKSAIVSFTLTVMVDTDGDGFVDDNFGNLAFPQDNCPTTYNPDQADADFDGIGDACDLCVFDPTNTGQCLEEILSDGLTLITPPSVRAGEPIWVTAVFKGSKQLLTFEPTCLSLGFQITSNGAVLPPRYVEGAPHGLPKNLIVIEDGEQFAATCEVGSLVDPTLLPQNGSINISATYSNYFVDSDWSQAAFVPGAPPPLGFPPDLAGTCGGIECYEVWSGSVSSLERTVNILPGGVVNRIEGEVTYDPTKWAIQWAAGTSLTVSANLTAPGNEFDVNDIDTTKPILLNGTAQALSTSVSGNVLTAVFNGKEALDSLPQQPLIQEGDTFFSTVQATFKVTGDLFTAEGGPIEIIDALVPIEAPNTINQGANGAIPVEIYGTATFDAAKVDAITLLFGGAPVQTKGSGQPQASVKDLNSDGFKDLKVQFDNEQFLLPLGQQIVILEGFMDDGTPIYGEIDVNVIPK